MISRPDDRQTYGRIHTDELTDKQTDQTAKQLAHHVLRERNERTFLHITN